MTGQRYSLRWWAFVVVHNCLVHPILPVADLFDVAPSRRLRRGAAFMFRIHDATAPKGAG